MYFQNRLCITKNSKIKQKILQEAHSSRYSIHPSSNKIYGDLEQMYWWLRMKGEISECVKMSNFSTACYDTRVEIETGYHGFRIKVTIEYEIKSIHTDCSLEKLAELYVAKIVRLHEVPLSIISNRDQ
ncbi:integrase [Gossypium australe]|uniref:Integrase n=1 Tax=Gossypium australe TaxID=47621 RepID=A0A5B6W577_9ROSI|nr:integrase [Gossypium australe]